MISSLLQYCTLHLSVGFSTAEFSLPVLKVLNCFVDMSLSKLKLGTPELGDNPHHSDGSFSFPKREFGKKTVVKRACDMPTQLVCRMKLAAL